MKSLFVGWCSYYSLSILRNCEEMMMEIGNLIIKKIAAKGH